MDTIFLTTCQNEAQALMIQSVLDSRGIASFIKNETVAQVFGNFAPFQMEIHVNEADLEKAREILNEGFPDLPIG